MEETKNPEQTSSEVKSEEQSSATPAPSVQPMIMKSYGREFDVSTEIGRAQLQGWMEAHESDRGRLAREKGELLKEVEPLRKYNLKATSVDEIGLLKQVDNFRSEGNHLEADRLMFELYQQQKKTTSEQLERERLWSDYQTQNAEDFKVLPADVMKDYVFRNYAKELAETDNPFSLLDRIIKPKVPKLPAQSAEMPPSVAGISTSAPKPAVSQTPAKTDKAENGSWNKMLDEFGFK